MSIDLREALKTLDLCDLCKIKLLLRIIDQELQERRQKEYKESEAPERLTFRQLCQLYKGNITYAGNQTKGFQAFLREQGYPEYIVAKAKDAKNKYKRYKRTQSAIAENQKEGYVLP